MRPAISASSRLTGMMTVRPRSGANQVPDGRYARGMHGIAAIGGVRDRYALEQLNAVYRCAAGCGEGGGDDQVFPAARPEGCGDLRPDMAA